MMSQEVRDWCRRQCEIQHATAPADIEGMLQAWRHARDVSVIPLTVGYIQDFAMLVDPVANPNGRFRTGPAVFMDGGTAAPANEIEDRIAVLFEWLSSDSGFTAEDFYLTLMWIHPFKDGNGRVGALVYNVLNGTIDSPVDPPEYR